MAAAEFTPSGLGDLSRTLALIDAADANIRRTFLALVAEAKGLRSLEEILELVNTGRTFEALALIEDVGPGLNEAITAAYISAGVSVAETLRGSITRAPLIRFDTLSARGVLQLQASQARLVRELTAQQSSALQIALRSGIGQGLTPKQIAASLRGSIGLTGVQAQSVANYRLLLTNLESAALARALRDKRFDGTVRRAILNGTPLTGQQIDRMVARYEQKLLTHRAQVIASTEALAAVNAGEAEMWAQAVDRGLNAGLVEQTWHPRFVNTRESHADMDGQIRPLGVAFTSGAGVALRWPGDSSAPAREVVSCHCVVSRTIMASPF
jgi:hypothetical protein